MFLSRLGVRWWSKTDGIDFLWEILTHEICWYRNGTPISINTKIYHFSDLLLDSKGIVSGSMIFLPEKIHEVMYDQHPMRPLKDRIGQWEILWQWTWAANENYLFIYWKMSALNINGGIGFMAQTWCYLCLGLGLLLRIRNQNAARFRGGRYPLQRRTLSRYSRLRNAWPLIAQNKDPFFYMFFCLSTLLQIATTTSSSFIK